jgi:hypothetical protein
MPTLVFLLDLSSVRINHLFNNLIHESSQIIKNTYNLYYILLFLLWLLFSAIVIFIIITSAIFRKEIAGLQMWHVGVMRF